MKIKTLHAMKIPRIIYIPKITHFSKNFFGKFQMKMLKKMEVTDSGVNKSGRKPRIIASLTTYSDRIDVVHYTLITLLKQTFKPDRLILWLSEDEFGGKELPETITELIQYGLEIKYCPEIRSHKKYYYCMKEFPDDVIVTFDDDIIYPEDQLEKLVKKWTEYPDAVIASEVRKLIVDENYILQDPWTEKSPSFGLKPEMLLLPIGCGGVLYPPHCLDDEVFNIEKIKELAYTTDDLWLKAMAMKKGTKAAKAEKWIRTLSEVSGSQSTRLGNINGAGGENIKSFLRILNEYPELKNIIRTYGGK